MEPPWSGPGHDSGRERGRDQKTGPENPKPLQQLLPPRKVPAAGERIGVDHSKNLALEQLVGPSPYPAGSPAVRRCPAGSASEISPKDVSVAR
jgi:hypothetical protein